MINISGLLDLQDAAVAAGVENKEFCGLSEQGELISLEKDLNSSDNTVTENSSLALADPETMKGFVDFGSALVRIGDLSFSGLASFKGLVYEDKGRLFKLLDSGGSISPLTLDNENTEDNTVCEKTLMEENATGEPDLSYGDTGNTAVAPDTADHVVPLSVSGSAEFRSTMDLDKEEAKTLLKKTREKKKNPNQATGKSLGIGSDNYPSENIQNNYTNPVPQSQRQSDDKVVNFSNKSIQSVMLSKKPVPNKGPQYFSVYSPYSLGNKVSLSFKMTRDGNPKLGRNDTFLRLKASKDGANWIWINQSDADNYRNGGYRVTAAPRIMGLDRLMQCDWGDWVFITDNPLDYYALNCSLARKWVWNYFKSSDIDDYETSSAADTVGCAVMGLNGYQFDNRAANDLLTGKNVVVINYGRKNDQSVKIAEYISMQELAESVRVWTPDVQVANEGLFRYSGFFAAEDANQINAACAICNMQANEGINYWSKLITAKRNGVSSEDYRNKVKPTEYYLYPLMPKGKINFLGGESGVGKTQILTDFAIRLAEGKNQIIESRYEQDDFGKLNILWLTKEEDPDIDIAPRLCEYDLDPDINFDIFDCSDPELYFRDSALESLISGEDLRFVPDVVFIDSFQAFLQGDTNNGDDVIKAVTWLKKLTKRYGVTFEIVHHFRKNNGWEDDFRAAFSGRHELFDFPRVIYAALKDPEGPEGRIVVHPVKLSKFRGTDRIPNLVYELSCRDERDAVSVAKLVDTDFRSQDVLKAQRERNRKDTLERVAESSKTKQEELEEKAEAVFERNGFIDIAAFKGEWKDKGYGVNTLEKALGAVAKKFELTRKKAVKTIFYKNGLSSKLSENSFVYVATEDSLDTPEGLAKLATGLREPVTESSLKAAAPTASVGNVKKAIKILKAAYGYDDVDGRLYRSETIKSSHEDYGANESQENIWPINDPEHWRRP